MRLCIRQIDEERLVGFCLPTHEVDCLVGQFTVDLRSHLRVVDLYLFRGAAFATVVNVFGYGVRTQVLLRDRIELILVRPQTFICRVGNAIPFIESLVCRKTAFRMAQVPLSKHSRRVACVRQHFGHRDFPLSQAVHARGDWHRGIARADRVAPGHKS